jgi:imidazole glycerol-phosphate synthase subunit HisH
MSKQLVAIVDYGMGNLHSARSALEHVGKNLEVVVTSDAEVIRKADRLVFPGVGAMRDCMAEICRLGFDQLIVEQVKQKPVLAICVGLQALLQHSSENEGVDCIGLVEGEVVQFDIDARDAEGNRLKVPHMGWNQVQQIPHPMWHQIEDSERFYFVHSYYTKPVQFSEIYGTTTYGVEFASVVSRPNLFAVQFHPEKSQHAGLQLLSNFLSWNGEF